MSVRELIGRLSQAVRRRSLDRDMDDEIRFHIDMETEKRVREGLSPAEARRRALVAFGGVERHRERLREGRTAPLFDAMAGDFRSALRAVRRDPLFSFLAAITIALGVGATASVFSAVNSLVLRTVDLPKADRLAGLMEERVGAMSQGAEGVRLPRIRYEKYVERTSDLFSSLAAFRYESFALRLGDETLAVNGARVSANYFSTLDLAPAVGRFLDRDDEPAAVISYQLWHSRFQADQDLVGRAIHLDSRTYTLVGVAPHGFSGTTVLRGIDVWVPLASPGLLPKDTAEFAGGWVGLLGRLCPGMSIDQAQARIDDIARSIPPDEPQTTVHGARLEPLTAIVGPSREVVGGLLAMLLVLALVVLFIAASNVAGMLLARSSRRRREIAMRLALGARRARLVRHLLAETLMFCVVGCGMGVALAWLATRAISRVPVPLEDIRIDVAPDTRVLLFSLVLTVGTGLLFGLWPALQASSVAPLPALKDGDGDHRGSRMRSVFVAGQVALSVLLLVLAGLFTHSLYQGLTTDLGYRTKGIAVSQVSLARHGYDETRGRMFFNELREAVSRVEGVEAVALATNVLGRGDRLRSDIHTPDPIEGGREVINASFVSADPDFLHMEGIKLVAGRGIAPGDVVGTSAVVVVSEDLAESFWPGVSALGRRLRFDDVDHEVVGVVRGGRFILASSAPRPFLFLPLAQDFHEHLAVYAMAPGNEGAALRAIAEEVRRLDPDIAVEDSATLEQVLSLALFPQRFAAVLVGLFGVVGLILASVGIYGVTSFHVARRTRELGIRRALGATGRDVVGQILGQASRLTLIGGAIGLGLGGLASLAARSAFINLHLLDPVTFLGVPFIIFLVVLIAAARPSARAASVSPSEALREG